VSIDLGWLKWRSDRHKDQRLSRLKERPIRGIHVTGPAAPLTNPSNDGRVEAVQIMLGINLGKYSGR
jgi:predicted component of type VI protein secretion system